ncbi:hypothetical protein Tco_1030776 [Tanacetum coccineum]|uniref:Uncharacterized protein n=1 Tax=Tanacetum coccineum TaxID=301880 RepID=A0ABQ5G8L6_9ASTR
MLQGLPKDIYKLINHNIKAKAILDNVKMLLAGSELTKEDRESQLYDEFERFKMLPCENINEYYDGRVVVQNVQGRQNQNQRNFTQGAGATGNGGAHNRAGNANAVLDEEELLFLADECDAFDSDVDDEPTAQSIFMASLSSAGPVNLQVGPSNASILSEVHDLDNAIDPSNNDQVEHEIHNEVQQKNVIESTSADIDEQMSILIRDHNKKEESLKKELHSVKLQLNSTIQNNKIIEETVTALKQEFKQKETKFLYDQDAKTAIGVQNPFYLRKAKKAQLALYDGDELLKMHHVPVIVTSSEEDLEVAETTRIKMNKKMNDPVCVEKRVKIIPPNYSKENIIATFTPQTQLTPEQVFWSNEIKEKKAEDLKAETPTLPVLPPDFKKTCKKRITPTGITEGERGFEQTKLCYLTKVIPFFNLLKEHFDEVQKSLVKEVRAMKVVFENLEAGVDQNAIAIKSANKSDEVSHLDYKSLDSQNLQLKETVIALQERLENFKAENEKVKQHHQELFNSIKITYVKTIEKITYLQTEIENLKTQLKGKRPYVTSNVETPKVSVLENYAIDVHPLPQPQRNNMGVHHGYLNRLRDTLDTLREIVEEARSNQPSDYSLEYACVYTKHSQELLEYLNASCPKANNKRDKFIATTPLTRKKHVTFADPLETSCNNTPKHVKQQLVHQTNVPIIPSTGVSTTTTARRS